MVPAADQRRVFARPARGVRKLVLATNIAETVRRARPALAALTQNGSVMRAALSAQWLCAVPHMPVYSVPSVSSFRVASLGAHGVMHQAGLQGLRTCTPFCLGARLQQPY